MAAINTAGGADLVLDEITAHARAACELNPQVDTIIEIGGQDAKYIRVSSGRIVESDMNKACSAGTGSFLEESAQGDLNIDSAPEIAPIAMEDGLRFAIREGGRTVGAGVVSAIIE